MKLLLTAIFACGSAACAARASSPSTTHEPLTDEPTLGEPPPPLAPSPSSAEDATRRPERPDAPTLVAGHRDARYEFVVPPGFRSGMRVKGGDPRELSEAGADGIGPDDDPVGLNSIVLFSDPLGLGVDWQTASAATRAKLLTAYGDLIRQRFRSASSAREVQVGPHRAIHVELSDVELSGRAPRRGRHYMVLDRSVTVSVDCLWTEAYAERMSAACDAVAASLWRVRRE